MRYRVFIVGLFTTYFFGHYSSLGAAAMAGRRRSSAFFVVDSAHGSVVLRS